MYENSKVPMAGFRGVRGSIAVALLIGVVAGTAGLPAELAGLAVGSQVSALCFLVLRAQDRVAESPGFAFDPAGERRTERRSHSAPS